MTGHDPATGDPRAGLAALLLQVIRRFFVQSRISEISMAQQKYQCEEIRALGWSIRSKVFE
jgi:hypothetical protein